MYIVVLYIFELRKLYFIYFKQFYNFHSIYLPTVIYCEFTSELLEIVTNEACRWLPNERHDILQFEAVVSACVLSQYFFVLMLLKSILLNVFYYCTRFTFRK